MQHVLVHIDSERGPIGAWSFGSGKLRHFYPESLDEAISERAREVMARRDLDVPVPQWMDFLADCDPTLLDKYQTLEVNDDLSLPAILADYRRMWSTQPD
jgi:hypothetical protein